MLVILYILLGLTAVVSGLFFLTRSRKNLADKAAMQNSKLKRQMTTNIAHELRTPVTSIRGYLETLISCPDMDPAKKQMFLEKAYNQTLRLSELISDMSLLSKMEERSSMLNKEEVDLYDIANEVFDEFDDRIEMKNNIIENLIEPGTVLMANRTLVYTIIRNLVENSLKYAGDAITMHLECHNTADKYYYLTYYDTGSGVPEDHLSRIFERFYRIEEGRTRDVGGSGLGLSIVRNAVKFHGGEIRANNRQSGGLQFFFSLRRIAD